MAGSHVEVTFRLDPEEKVNSYQAEEGRGSFQAERRAGRQRWANALLL